MINDSMSKPIGGYFEIEHLGKGRDFPQPKGLKLNTGRNALEYILSSIGKVSKLYIPYYTCEVILEPLNKLAIPYEFYHINQRLELSEEVVLQKDEYLLYTNYFGIKDSYVKYLYTQYGTQFIVDCAQALYSKRIDVVKAFYSPRKFVGIPDGAIAYMENGIDSSEYGDDNSDGRMSHLFIRKEQGPQAGYADFRCNAGKLKMQPILNMSLKTKDLLAHIDFEFIKERRLKNFLHLHKFLAPTNKFSEVLNQSIMDFECPMIYPYWTSDQELKSRLIKEQVFVATYWPNVLEWTQPGMIEYEFANNLLAIPCDQRYGEEDMNRIIDLICK